MHQLSKIYPIPINDTIRLIQIFKDLDSLGKLIRHGGINNLLLSCKLLFSTINNIMAKNNIIKLFATPNSFSLAIPVFINWCYWMGLTWPLAFIMESFYSHYFEDTGFWQAGSKSAELCETVCCFDLCFCLLAISSTLLFESVLSWMNSLSCLSKLFSLSVINGLFENF